MPATVESFLAFLAHCFNHGVPYFTVKVYAAAVGARHSEHNLPSPTNAIVVLQALGGYKRLRSAVTDKRLPITVEIMRFLKSRLFSSELSIYEKCLFWSAFTLAFFAFLRVGEFTTSPHCTHFLDISSSATNITVNIPSSKTDQLGQGCTMALSATGRSVLSRACNETIHHPGLPF